MSRSSDHVRETGGRRPETGTDAAGNTGGRRLETGTEAAGNTGGRRPETGTEAAGNTGGRRLETGTDAAGNTGGRRLEAIEVKARGAIRGFEDLEVWKLGVALAADVYRVLRASRDRSFADQIQRSAVSIPSNIAEGFERGQNKEFVQFLYYSRGSCGELRTQLMLAVEVGLIEAEFGQPLIETTRRVSAMLSSYIEVRKRNF